MYGEHKAIDIADFEALFYRNCYTPWEFRFVRHDWGARNGAPTKTCALVRRSIMEGNGISVPYPQIPEMTQYRRSDPRYIAHRGWRALIVGLCNDNWLKPTPEIERLLGPIDYERARKGVACF